MCCIYVIGGESLTINLPAKLTNNQFTYNELSKLIEIMTSQETIAINFEKTVFIQPNILALLSQSFYYAKQSGKTIQCRHVTMRLARFLSQYHFIKSITQESQHYLTTSKFFKQERPLFEEMLISKLNYLKESIQLYLIVRLGILFDLMSHSDAPLFVSGYCNLNQDWFCLTLASETLLFETESDLEQALERGEFKQTQVIEFSIFMKELLALGGKIFIGTQSSLYQIHHQIKFNVEGQFIGTFITLHIPIHLV